MYIEQAVNPNKVWGSSSVQFIIPKGRRERNILVITERQMNVEQPSMNVLSHNQAETMRKILEHLHTFEKVPIPNELHFIDVPDDDLEQETIDNLNKFINKNNIDIVVCAGLNTAASLLNLTPWRTSQLRSRILKDNRLSVPIIPTFPIRQGISDNPKDWKTLINLLGFIKEDIATACLGKNRYTIKTDIDYKIIKTLEGWKAFYKKLLVAPTVAMDTEGKNLNKRFGNVTYIIQLAIERDFAHIIPIDHRRTPFTSEEIAIIKADLKYFFETTRATIITQNGKYDYTVMRGSFNVEYYSGYIYDVSAGEYFLDENRKYMWGLRPSKSPINQKNNPKTLPAYQLETFVAQYSGKFPYDDSRIGKAERNNINDHSLKDVAPYCARDVIYIWRIMECQIAEAQRRGGFYNKYLINVTCLASAMTNVFSEMEYEGILLDGEYLKTAVLPNSDSRKLLKNIEEDLYKLPNVIEANRRLLKKEKYKGTSASIFTGVPWVFNINTMQHQQVLFIDVMGLKPLKRRKNDDASIDDKFLTAYENHPEIIAFSDLRANQKLFNTYLKGFAKILRFNPDSKDSRITSSYDFLSVVTVRTSSSDPALQQIPSHGDSAKIIKRAFISNFLGILLKVDYNAHEVRIWGNLARDKVIAKAFLVGMKIRRELRIWQAQNFDLAYEAYDHLTKIGWFLEKENKITGQKPFDMATRIKIANKLPKRYRYLAAMLIELMKKGDVHNNNYSFFFGIPPENVTKPQRQSVKQTVFGAMYGKCLVGVMNIQTSNGFYTIKQLWDKYLENNKNIDKAGSKVASHTGYGNYNYVMKTRGKTWVLTNSLGDEIQGLPDHKLWALNADKKLDFVRLDQLPPGSKITKSIGTNLFARKTPVFNYNIPKYKNSTQLGTLPKHLSVNVAVLFGLFVAEGDTRGRFSNSDKFILDVFSKYLKTEFNIIQKANYTASEVYLGAVLKDLFNYYLGEVKSNKRFIPDIIKQAPKKYQVAFLQGLFEGDGTVYRHQSSWLVEYTSTSKLLAYDVKLLLENIGILCRVDKAYKSATNTIDKRKILSYNVRVINQYFPQFCKEVGFYPQYNKQKLLELAVKETQESFKQNPHLNSLCPSNLIPSNYYLIKLFEELDMVCRSVKYVNSYIANDIEKKRINCYKLGAITGSTHIQLKVKNGEGITQHAYEILKLKIKKAPKELAKAIKNNKTVQELFKEVDNIASYQWVDVISSKSTGKTEDVYDLGVPGTNSYHVQGFIGHNTGETLGEDLNEKEVRQIKLDNPDADYKELRELLNSYHEMGRELIDKMFATFKQGYDWIIEKQVEAKKFYRTVSPIGAVRHLWIYFLNHQTLINRADRLASNSINQGLASNLGYIGAREFQTLRFMAKKAGTDLTTKSVNSVHDSLENEVYLIANLPFALYYLEHSLMTRTAKVSKEVYGFELMIGLEAEFELGMYMSNLKKYAFTEYSFFQIINNWITEQEAHFKRPIPRKEYLLQFLKEAYRLVETHRAKELARVQKYEPETRITLTLEAVADFKNNSHSLRTFMKAIKGLV